MKDNAVCLCRGCHMFYTERPHDWAEITEIWLGKERLDAIRFASRNGEPVKDPEKEIIGLKLIEQIKEMGLKPVCGIGKKRKKGTL